MKRMVNNNNLRNYIYYSSAYLINFFQHIVIKTQLYIFVNTMYVTGSARVPKFKYSCKRL